MKSMYSLPSTSQTRQPAARSMKYGETPNGNWVLLLLKVWEAERNGAPR